MRLWLLGEIQNVTEGLSGLIRVMVERADQEKDILLPGYTHLQVWTNPLEPQLEMTKSSHSVANPLGGLIYFYLMHSPSTPTSNACNN